MRAAGCNGARLAGWGSDASPFCACNTRPECCLQRHLRLAPNLAVLRLSAHIRRALGDDVLPPGLNGDPNGYPIGKGADLFISMWNLHRCALQ